MENQGTNYDPDMDQLIAKIQQDLKDAPEGEPLPEEEIKEPRDEEPLDDIPIEPEEEVNLDELEEDIEPEEDTEKEKPKKNKLTDKDKVRKALNDKYRERAEKLAALKEVEELKRINSELTNSGIYHYGRNIDAEIAKHQEDRLKYLAEGDGVKLNEADIALMRAMIKKERLEENTYKPPVDNYPQDHYQNQPHQRQAQAPADPYQSLKDDILYDWLEDHPYLQQNSDEYDSKLLRKVNNFVMDLDQKLTRTNRQDLYYSPTYFEKIDKFIDSERSGGGEITNAPARVNSSVGGVRNSYSYEPQRRANPKVSWTEDDDLMAQNSGYDPKEFKKVLLKEKLKVLQENKRNK